MRIILSLIFTILANITFCQKSKITDPNDPFLPYLTGMAPEIIKNLGEEADSVKIKKIIFHSRDVNHDGKTVPTEIFAVIARPIKSGNYPGILVLHGGGGTAEMERIRKWAAKGYIALSIDIPGLCAPEKVPNSSGYWKTAAYGMNRFTASPDITHSTIFDGVLAAVQALYLLRLQPGVIKERIGVTGISWGGYMTTIVSGLAGAYIRASFSTYGCGFYDTASTFLPLLDKMPAAERTAWVKYLDAGRRAKYITAPFFIAAATNDNWFYPPAVMATLHAMKGPVNHFFASNSNHSAPVPGGNSSSGQVGYMQMEEPYFNYYLKDTGLPLPVISIEERNNYKDPAGGTYRIRFHVKSKSKITAASIYYSLSDSSWGKRLWIPVKASVSNQGYYEAVVPAMAVGKEYRCFASVSDERPVTVSSEMIVLK